MEAEGAAAFSRIEAEGVAAGSLEEGEGERPHPTMAGITAQRSRPDVRMPRRTISP
jgi:hypothetical protein